MEDAASASALPVQSSTSYYNFTLDFTSILSQWKLLPTHLRKFQPHGLNLNYSGLVLKFSNLWNLRAPPSAATATARQWAWDWDKLVEMGMDSERHGPSLDEIGSVLAETTWPEADSILEAAAGAIAGEATQVPAAARLPPPSLPDYPGPWNYMFSGYTLGIILMVIILHRIQNIVVPSPAPSYTPLLAQIPRSRRGDSRRTYRQLPPGVAIPWSTRFAVPLMPFTAIFNFTTSSISSIRDMMFPLDLTKTSTRFAIHLPTLYWLTKMLLVWGLLILQTADIWPSGSLAENFTFVQSLPAFCKSPISWVDQFANRVQHSSMDDICWTTFLAVVTSFLLESFIKALDGVEAGFPVGGNSNANTSPLTILLYSFLLHLYSSPFTHASIPKSATGAPLPSRPDKNAVITVAIPLVQLTLFHAMSTRRRWAGYRLGPTALTSLLSLIHFYGALYSYFYGSVGLSVGHGSLLGSMVPTETTSAAGAATKVPMDKMAAKAQLYIAQRQAHAKLYPILNYIPNIFETLMILTTLLTVVLNILVQLVVRGRVDRVFNGLALRPTIRDEGHDGEPTITGFRTFLSNLPQEEDFGVLLLRMGAATLEATGLRGWSNEVAPIYAPSRSVLRHRSRRSANRAALEPVYGSVKLGRAAAGGVQNGTRAVPPPLAGGSQSPNRARRPPQKVRPTRGLRNEVRTVDLGLASASTRPSIWWVPSMQSWARELKRYGGAVLAAAKGLAVLIWCWTWSRFNPRSGWKNGRGRAQRWEAVADEGDGGEYEEAIEAERQRVDAERDVYERFLKGEIMSDEEDGDYDVEEDDQDSDGSDSSLPSPHEEDEPEREAFSLFVDLVKNGLGWGGSQSQIEETVGVDDTVISHLIAQKGRYPLTRGRLAQRQQLIDYGSEVGDESEEVEPLGSGRAGDKESALCVVCISEVRDVLCWPCRCLAMCDGCREALSAQSGPSKHRCPCCRQLIDGYSKIYIP